ncbi:class I SAM-dependent methyltransferase [Methyloversatilis sp. XJ19-13]|uniref:class I SAM-dependent methyltransferase n=1 Tax=Methyloversatilis sp. XJ19-13 TaxID=2963430 RepID=UPI00211BFE97|nr:class I SAM-dependent methyltransferase [Methyloversatilis sp. XJ19-13]MCQ9374588.1 class I SAM-dependent methyltransferase [Methyloversatilis sp. XJ19-13]
MTATFADHFATLASQYASSRPTYPPALFDWLAERCAARDCVWDCGTGTGQAAVDLGRVFGRVVATDASAAQIAEATPHARVDYRVAPAEASGLDDASVDLVVVAQALHWFDLDRFYPEARRVLKPGGVIAAWCYGVLHVGDEGDAVDHLVQHFYHDEVGPWWPAERHHVETAYRDLPFPFALLPAPDFALSARWTPAQLLGYLRSWSATARFMAANGFDPVERLSVALHAAWGDPTQARTVSWPLSLRVGVCCN